MFARVLEMKTKRGQARALCTAIENEIKPIAEKYPGFLEGACMLPEESPDSVLVISFWENQEAAKNFGKEGYPKVSPIYERFTEGSIDVRNCNVMAVPTFKARAAKASGAGR